jgi:hypothetical protein
VGRPNKNVAGHSAAGAVTLFRFDYSGKLVAHKTFTQNSAHVDGHPEKGDRFGSAIGFTSIDLVVGVPGENTSKGIVQILTWAHPETPVTESYNWSLDTKGVPGTARAGDRFGAALAVGHDGMIIGVPGREVGSATNAGAILAARINAGYDPLGDPTTLGHSVLVSQDSKNADGHTIAGTAETGDAFGSVVRYDGCRTSRSGSCIVVGIPGEDVSGHKDAGAFWIATDRTLRDIAVGDIVVTQGTRGIPGAVQTGNRFGAALSLFNQVRLTIGVPGDHAHPHGSVIRLDLPFLYGRQTNTSVEQWTPSSGVSAGAAVSDLDGYY